MNPTDTSIIYEAPYIEKPKVPKPYSTVETVETIENLISPRYYAALYEWSSVEGKYVQTQSGEILSHRLPAKLQAKALATEFKATYLTYTTPADIRKFNETNPKSYQYYERNFNIRNTKRRRR